MNRSEVINELATALSKVQGEMNSAAKNVENPFFKSTYANHASVHEASRPLLAKNGLCVTQAIGDNAGKMHLTTLLMHTSGQWISSEVPLNPLKPDPQSLGSCLSYMRRYAEMAIIGIASDEDDDGNKASGKGDTQVKKTKVEERPPAAKTTATSKPTLVTEPQLARLFTIGTAKGWSKSTIHEFIKAKLNKASTKELTWKEYDRLVTHIEGNPRKREPGAEG